MENHTENVILFPKWRTLLEEESLAALKEKKYEEALMKLDHLISYGIYDHEIMIGKLICLMELNRYKEAQDLCEALLIHKDDNYYHYVHIYLTILFQTSQYQVLMDQVEYEFEFKTIPDDIKEQFQQLYDMSSNMWEEIRDEKSSEYIDELSQAIEAENYQHQYIMVEKIRKMNINPKEKIRSFLINDRVHPVTKTAIFNWLQEKNVTDKLEIRKLMAESVIAPDTIPALESHPLLKQVQLFISELEQENPTLYQLMAKLLYHYFYVRYPLLPQEDDVKPIASALTRIGEDYLDIHTTETTTDVDKQVNHYIEEIKMCDALYSSIVEL